MQRVALITLICLIVLLPHTLPTLKAQPQQITLQLLEPSENPLKNAQVIIILIPLEPIIKTGNTNETGHLNLSQVEFKRFILTIYAIHTTGIYYNTTRVDNLSDINRKSFTLKRYTDKTEILYNNSPIKDSTPIEITGKNKIITPSFIVRNKVFGIKEIKITINNSDIACEYKNATDCMFMLMLKEDGNYTVKINVTNYANISHSYTYNVIRDTGVSLPSNWFSPINDGVTISANEIVNITSLRLNDKPLDSQIISGNGTKKIVINVTRAGAILCQRNILSFTLKDIYGNSLDVSKTIYACPRVNVTNADVALVWVTSRDGILACSRGSCLSNLTAGEREKDVTILFTVKGKDFLYNYSSKLLIRFSNKSIPIHIPKYTKESVTGAKEVLLNASGFYYWAKPQEINSPWILLREAFNPGLGLVEVRLVAAKTSEGILPCDGSIRALRGVGFVLILAAVTLLMGLEYVVLTRRRAPLPYYGEVNLEIS
ncbi:hypothetical protein IG193_07820 [Infirmifilum lucidum]|uniref:Uncharacterized protein n=1 Tax=Infirmifilum lucidum TaxID=2776706 RepID=A0A7L9FH49_9CREN|nr:hypothetical protein [Infirmifilum lucidum]QOJ78652.1 hypothetical protein IG193_07820 [Infirmifilum lucidum]